MSFLILIVSVLAGLFGYQLKEESINQDGWIEEKISNFQIFIDIIISFTIGIGSFGLFSMLITYLQQNGLLGNNIFYNYIGYIIFVIVFYLLLIILIKHHNVFTKKDDIKKLSEGITVYFFITYIIGQFIFSVVVSFVSISDNSNIETYVSDIEKIQNEITHEYINDTDYQTAEYIKKIENKKVYNSENTGIIYDNSIVEKNIDKQKSNILINTNDSNLEEEIKRINKQLDKKVTEYIKQKESSNSIDVLYNNYDLSNSNDNSKNLFDIDLKDRWGCYEEGYPKLLSHGNKYFVARAEWSEKDIENFIKYDTSDIYGSDNYPFSFIVETNFDNLNQVDKYIGETTSGICKVNGLNEEGYLNITEPTHDGFGPGYCHYKDYLYKNNILISIYYGQDTVCKGDYLILKSIKVK